MGSKRSIILSAVFCALLFGFMNSKAQTVSGLIQFKGKAMEGVNVYLFSLRDSNLVVSEFTQTDGSFSFINHRKDSVFLVCFMTGYEDFFSVNFKGEKDFGKIELISNGDLSEVVINVKKPFQEVSAHGNTFNISQNPLLSKGDALRTLRKLPGVQILQGSDISVNGKSDATVYINGKRTYMDGKALLQFLQTIPADQIVKIEVFDVAPAKFDAEGRGSVINVILKEKPFGTFGRTYTEFGYGNYYKVSPSINFNHRSNRLAFYGDVRGRSQKTNEQSLDSTVLNKTNGEHILNDYEIINQEFIYNGKIGVDYYLNSKNEIGFFFSNVSRFDDEEQNSNSNIISSSILDYNKFTGVSNNNKSNFRNHYNLSYNLKINDSSNFSSDLFYIRTNISDDIRTTNDLFLNGTLADNNVTTNDAKSNINIAVAKIDFYKEFKRRWKIESGAKCSYIYNHNSFKAFAGSNDDNLVLNLNTSNDFIYEENVSAGYISLQKKWTDKWSTDIGGRGENTIIIGNSPTEALQLNKNYFNFFPNASVVYTPKKNHSFSLLYTQRIERPRTTELNPFVKTISQLEFESGNFDLDPSIEKVVNFKYIFMNALNFSIENGRADNYYSIVINQNLNTGEQLWIPENIGDATFTSVSLASPIPFGKIGGAYLYLGYFDAQLNAPPNLYRVKAFTGFIGTEWYLPQKWTIGLQGFYVNNGYWNIWLLEPFGSANFTLSKEWKKWDFSFEAFDFLNILRNDGRAIYNDLDMYTGYKDESRRFFLTASYRFGKSRLNKIKKNLDESSNEEINRTEIKDR